MPGFSKKRVFFRVFSFQPSFSAKGRVFWANFREKKPVLVQSGSWERISAGGVGLKPYRLNLGFFLRGFLAQNRSKVRKFGDLGFFGAGTENFPKKNS